MGAATMSTPKANSTTALTCALADTGTMSLIQVHLDLKDCSHALSRLASRLSARI